MPYVENGGPAPVSLSESLPTLLPIRLGEKKLNCADTTRGDAPGGLAREPPLL